MNKDFIKKFLFPAVTAVLVISIYMTFPLYFEESILAMYMFNATRLVLLLFMFFSLYLYFINELKYRGEIQKIFFRGTLLSLLFSIFTSAGFLTVYFKNPDMGIENYDLFGSWLIHVLKIVKYGMLYTVLTLTWIYFHPQNLTRRRKKETKTQ
jgi:hypothetical protein